MPGPRRNAEAPVSDKLNILFFTAELTPLMSTGGLAEVAQALPRALKRAGHDVRVIMPLYTAIPAEHRGTQRCMCVADMGSHRAHGALRESRVPGTDIPLYLVEHEGYFGRPRPYGTDAYEYQDNAERFCFFSAAGLHGICQTGWRPDVVHCHDWHSSPVPTLLRTLLKAHPFWGGMATVFTVHNLAFQGRYPADRFAHTGFPHEYFSPEAFEYEGDMNLMKACIKFAHRLTTVSPRYAKEIQTLEYGEGLDGVLRTRKNVLEGILNGVDYDVWNPAKDPHIPANYTPDDLRGKSVCKAALQESFGLPQRPDVPLFGIVSRLVWQKGFDLLVDSLEELAETELQIAIIGSGAGDLEHRIWEATQRFPESVAVWFGYDIPRSHCLQAGSDFLLMPSRYEPCGLSQMYGLKYGTVPIVRRTGGLADSVQDINAVNRRRGTATGITYVPNTPQAVARAVRRAVALYDDKPAMAGVVQHAMAQDFSWKRSCEAYIRCYREAIAAI